MAADEIGSPVSGSFLHCSVAPLDREEISVEVRFDVSSEPPA